MRTVRLRGYSILVSNDTVLPPSESSCYTDPGNVTLPTIIENDCEETARYVWIYKNSMPQSYDPSPSLELCRCLVSNIVQLLHTEIL